MGFNPVIPVGNLVEYSRGGGWGKETPFEGSSRVAIIRGADFPSVAQGSYGGLPVRYEKDSKVNSVTLRAGDIVLENSGGTDSRPTGRTVFVTNELIDAYDCPVIPASFCRLLRFDNRTNSEFVYYWLQEMYSAGRTWGYQNRSTGLSNFQYKVFADSELLPDLPIEVQSKIASVLSAFEKKIRENNRQNDYLERCCQSLFDDIQNDRTNEVIQLSDVAAVNPKRHLTKGSLARCVEMANLSTSGSFPNDWCRKAYSGGMKFMNGDTILARITPCLENGKTAYINFLDEGEVAFGSTEYIVLASKGLLPAEFFYFLARNRAFVSYATNHMNGSSGRQRVSAQDIEAYRLRTPSSSQAARFADFARPIMEEILTRSLENRRLSSLRGALLPKLLSGEIDVSKVEIPTPPNNHLSAG